MSDAVNEQEIYRSATALIRSHGRRAESEAQARVDGWTRQKAPQSAAVWRRILAAVQELQRSGSLSNNRGN